MTTKTSVQIMSLYDTCGDLPEAIMAADRAPSHASELTGAEVVEIAELLGIDFAVAPFSIEDLQQGLEIELDLEQEVDCLPSVGDWLEEDLVEVGKVAVGHLREQPDFYTWLALAHAPGDSTPSQYVHADVGTD
jgi:hypothetical protein